jgi:hypothetical protein
VTRVAAALALVLSCALGRVAAAQTPLVPSDPAFPADRLAPPPGPGAFFHVEDGDVADRGQVVAHASLSLSGRPVLVRHVLSGEELSAPVSLRAGLDVGVAVGVRPGLQLGAALPLVVFQDGDRLRGLDLPDGERALAVVAVGDLRLHGKWRVVEPPSGLGQALAVDLVLTLPTGNDDDFVGEAGVVVELRLVGSYRTERWAVAVNLGPRFRAEEVVWLAPGTKLGNEVAWGAAGSVVVPGAGGLEAIGEVAGARGDHGVSPAEGRLGARVPLARGVSLAVHVGAGLVDEVGAPAWRAGLEARVEPRPRLDRDRDGVPDAVDRCPREAEDLDGFEDADGCVDADDDADGVLDAVDECLDAAEDHDQYLDDDGCPEADNDGDRILDDVDPCPNDADNRCDTA